MNKAIKRYWPIFLLPTMAAFLIGFIVPFIEGIYLSFCDFTTIKDATFVGFSNYMAAFKDTTFVDAFKFTTLFAIVVLVLINVLAFFGGTGSYAENEGNEHFQNGIFYAESDRWYCIRLCMAVDL